MTTINQELYEALKEAVYDKDQLATKKTTFAEMRTAFLAKRCRL